MCLIIVVECEFIAYNFLSNGIRATLFVLRLSRIFFLKNIFLQLIHRALFIGVYNAWFLKWFFWLKFIVLLSLVITHRTVWRSLGVLWFDLAVFKPFFKAQNYTDESWFLKFFCSVLDRINAITIWNEILSKMTLRSSRNVPKSFFFWADRVTYLRVGLKQGDGWHGQKKWHVVLLLISKKQHVISLVVMHTTSRWTTCRLESWWA